MPCSKSIICPFLNTIPSIIKPVVGTRIIAAPRGCQSYQCSSLIHELNRTVQTIGKHIIACKSLPCTDIPIPIYKPANLRVIVTVMQVIQPCLRIQIVPTIAEGVQVRDVLCTGNLLTVSVLYGDGIAPAVINICHYTPERNISSGYSLLLIIL